MIPLADPLANRTWTDVLTGAPIEAEEALDLQSLPADQVAVLAAE
jgi:hypothetical protein